jgi:hypothetical protein
MPPGFSLHIISAKATLFYRNVFQPDDAPLSARNLGFRSCERLPNNDFARRTEHLPMAKNIDVQAEQADLTAVRLLGQDQRHA